jgi:SAM-dependent methyltransferase
MGIAIVAVNLDAGVLSSYLDGTMTLEVTTDLLSILAEPTRVRLLALLEKGELSVVDIVTVTDLGQSRVSTHLSKLLGAGLLRDRRQGASTLYSIADAMPEQASKLWELVRTSATGGVVDRDASRLDALLRARRKSEPWHDALAGQMERHYSPGRTWESLARGVLGLLDLGAVLDIGSGDGALAELLAPRARAITCVDKSDKMTLAAKKRLARFGHVEVREANACDLPFTARSFDVVTAFNVLVHLEDPAVAIAEAVRVLKKGGLFAVVTLDAHEERDLAREYGHVHLGLSPASLKRMLGKAGLTALSCAATSRERRPPHLSIVTAFGRKGTEPS